MVILDSNHRHGHVRAELELYAPLVSVGCYLVVCDTFVENVAGDMGFNERRGSRGDNPMTAVREFMGKVGQGEIRDDAGGVVTFETDTARADKLMLSQCPGGYLRRTG